jgi:hypothetical protein
MHVVAQIGDDESDLGELGKVGGKGRREIALDRNPLRERLPGIVPAWASALDVTDEALAGSLQDRRQGRIGLAVDSIVVTPNVLPA